MKSLFIPLVLLCASTAYAASPTPIEFQTIVSLDRFRITNTSPSAFLNEVIVRPSANLTPVFSDPTDMFWAELPPWPGDDRTGFFVSRFSKNRWVEFVGTWDANATLEMQFNEGPPHQQRGYIFAGIADGTYSGWTIPEPGSVVLLLVAVAACVVAWKRKTLTPR